jgi:hypothetical protein
MSKCNAISGSIVVVNSASPVSARLFAFCAALLLSHASTGLAETKPGCLDFRAVGHATAPSLHPYLPTDIWGADLWGVLGGQLVSGYITGNDGDVSDHGASSTGKNGSYHVALKDSQGGAMGSFWIQVHSEFSFPPGKAGVGYYKGLGIIVQGKGEQMFAYASGSFDWAGPFVAWDDTTNELGFSGRFNPEIKGSICGLTD